MLSTVVGRLELAKQLRDTCENQATHPVLVTMSFDVQGRRARCWLIGEDRILRHAGLRYTSRGNTSLLVIDEGDWQEFLPCSGQSGSAAGHVGADDSAFVLRMTVRAGRGRS